MGARGLYGVVCRGNLCIYCLSISGTKYAFLHVQAPTRSPTRAEFEQGISFGDSAAKFAANRGPDGLRPGRLRPDRLGNRPGDEKEADAKAEP